MRSHELFMRAQYPKTHPAATDANQQPLFFHVSCFTCCVCQQPLAAGDPYTIDVRSSRPICRSDYLSSRDASECSAKLSDSSESRPRTRPCHPATSKRSGSRSVEINNQEMHHKDHTVDNQTNCLSDPVCPRKRHFHPKPLNSPTCHGNKRIRTSLTDDQRLHLQKAFEVNQRPPKTVSFYGLFYSISAPGFHRSLIFHLQTCLVGVSHEQTIFCTPILVNGPPKELRSLFQASSPDTE